MKQIYTTRKGEELELSFEEYCSYPNNSKLTLIKKEKDEDGKKTKRRSKK